MKEKNISGIQQIGIGVPNMKEAWKWYKDRFGYDVRVFEEAAVAQFMLPYTGGKPQKRHAALALNMQGGGGFEIWQYVGRIPQPVKFEIQAGDLGMFAAKIKCKDASAAYDMLKMNGTEMLGGITKDPRGTEHFFVKDPLGNIFQLVSGSEWFMDEGKVTGGSLGVMIGVTDIDKSLAFYKNLLNYDDILYDVTGSFSDLSGIPGGSGKCRRVLLSHRNPRKGAFSPLLGKTEIELVQSLDRTPRKIFEDRFWGDMGFIHLCFDIQGMGLLRQECKEKGFPFTVDVDHSFDMGEAAGSFSYTEDPDGTLIEFVETHKIPILKKFGIYLNLRKRDPEKQLPNWMLKMLRFGRAKDI
jgi:catechol 2,3-dioxygenase-like lactoylglutathione lyase family enzyme